MASSTGGEDPDGDEACTGEATMEGFENDGELNEGVKAIIEGVIWLGVSAGE